MKAIKHHNTDSILNRTISIYIFPFVIAIVMCIAVGMAVIRTESPYLVNTCIGIIIVLVLWSVLFLYDQHKVMAGLSDRHVKGFLAITLSAVAVGFFLSMRRGK